MDGNIILFIAGWIVLILFVVINTIPKKPNYKYDITLLGENNHITRLQGNSDLLLKWARNVAEIFDKKVIVVMPSGWAEKNNWIPVL